MERLTAAVISHQLEINGLTDEPFLTADNMLYCAEETDA
jgi:hypothetical protein